MTKINLCTMDKDELLEVTQDLLLARFQDREVSAPAAAQVLGISISTLNRWVSTDVVRPVEDGQGKRVERFFNLAYLLSLDVNKLKYNYRYNTNNHETI